MILRTPFRRTGESNFALRNPLLMPLLTYLPSCKIVSYRAEKNPIYDFASSPPPYEKLCEGFYIFNRTKSSMSISCTITAVC